MTHALAASGITVEGPVLGSPALGLLSSIGFHALLTNPGIRWQWVYAAQDTAETDAETEASGNVLANDVAVSKAVSQVAGSAANVGVAVTGSAGGLFTIGSDGTWTFDPNSEFSGLTGEQTVTTSVTYHVSDGVEEDDGTLTVIVSAAIQTTQLYVGNDKLFIGTSEAHYVV